MSKRKLNKEFHVRDIYFNQLQSSKTRNLGPVEYTKAELIDWCLKQPTYHTLHAAWVASGFQRSLGPSVDRIDDYQPYRLSNIQITTVGGNLAKAFKDCFDGINTKRSRGVVQMDESYQTIAEFPSCNAAGRAMGAVNGSMISAVCSGKRQHAHNFRWRYA